MKKKGKGAKPLTTEQLKMLREKSRNVVVIDGLDNGVAVMYLSPKVIDSMASEIIRYRTKAKK